MQAQPPQYTIEQTHHPAFVPRAGGVPGTPFFNETDPKYQCCCGSMHVRTGAIIIGVLELISAFLGLVGASIQLTSGSTAGYAMASIISGYISVLLTVIVVGLMFYSMKTERKGFIIPHLVMQILEIIVMAIYAIVAIVMAFIGGVIIVANNDRNTGSAAAISIGIVIAVLIVLGLCIAFQFWWFFVILRLYRFYRDKENAGFANVQVNMQPIIQPTYNNNNNQPSFDNKGFTEAT